MADDNPQAPQASSLPDYTCNSERDDSLIDHSAHKLNAQKLAAYEAYFVAEAVRRRVERWQAEALYAGPARLPTRPDDPDACWDAWPLAQDLARHGIDYGLTPEAVAEALAGVALPGWPDDAGIVRIVLEAAGEPAGGLDDLVARLRHRCIGALAGALAAALARSGHGAEGITLCLCQLASIEGWPTARQLAAIARRATEAGP